MEIDAVTPTGCGVLVIQDGKILIGERKDNGFVCGLGGHIEVGETPEEAAIRETREEFGFNIAETIPLTIISGMPAEYCPSQVFVCTEFYGTPIAFNTEMENARFEPVSDVLKHKLFLLFELSVRVLLNQLYNINQDAVNGDGWITVNGQHIEVNENEEQISGNPKVFGTIEKQNNNSNSQKKQLQNSPNDTNIKAKELLKNKIELGEITTKLNPDLQKNHSKDTHTSGRSYFEIEDSEVQQIVDEKHGTGTVYVRVNGNAEQIKEILSLDKDIGKAALKDGSEESTDKMVVHYSKSRTHAMPTRRDKHE